MKPKIDFVITWVDCNDKKWQKEKSKYENNNKNEKNESNSVIRYRDWETLKYWFRGIEKNASWVNKIYFITCGQIPKWLNTDNEKLVLVNHDDYIPEEFLPTYNSNVIELYMNRIKGLSEHFVYFNDDMYILSKINETDFFKNGYPKDALVFNAASVYNTNTIIEHTILNNLEILSSHFDKRKIIKSNFSKVFNIKYGKSLIRSTLLLPWKYFTGVENQHIPISYLKSNWDMLWSKEEDRLNEIGKNRFRTKNDISHWIIRYWQLFNGDFYPDSYKGKEYYSLSNDNDKFFKRMKSGKIKIACINDTDEKIEYERVKKELINTFESIYPEKSSFER